MTTSTPSVEIATGRTFAVRRTDAEQMRLYFHNRRNWTFILQLPYLNQDGAPYVVDINSHDAEKLVVRGKTHRVFDAGDGDIAVVTPVRTAWTNVEFQTGTGETY